MLHRWLTEPVPRPIALARACALVALGGCLVALIGGQLFALVGLAGVGALMWGAR